MEAAHAMQRIVDRFFGNSRALRELLVGRIRRARESLPMRQDELDLVCGLGNPIPRCADFEANPDLLTTDLLCRVAFPLGLTLDGILDVDLADADNLQFAVDHMRTAGSGSGGEAGSERYRMPSLEEQAPFYVRLKALDEMGQDGA
jgi:hypothetical protein